MDPEPVPGPVTPQGSRTGCASRAVMTAFFLVFAGMGAVATVAVAHYSLEALGTYRWAQTPCTVLSSGVEREGGTATFRVRYRYEAGGQTYESERVSPGYGGSSDYSEAQRLADRFPAGAGATCLVDPGAPSSSALQRAAPWGIFAVFFPLIFVAVGVGGLWFVWRGGRSGRRGDPGLQEPITEKATAQDRVRAVLVPFFGLFFLVGLGTLYPLGIRPVLRLVRSQTWPYKACTVISSDVRSHRGDKGTTYSVDILYSYEVGGKEYRSNRYDFAGGSSSGYDAKAEVVARFPAGGRAFCYVNPGDPYEAVLNRAFGGMYLLGIVPLIFTFVGVVGMTFFLRMRPRTPRGMRGISSAGRAGALGVRGHAVPAPATAPTLLRAQISPFGKLALALFIAAFWNGIVSVFLFDVVSGWRRGRGDILESIFLLPFLAVGLGLVAWIGYQFLALFNPRPRVELEAAQLRLGEAVRASWTFSGRPGRISSLTILLEGREEATFQRGTRTVTDKAVFESRPLVQATRPEEIASGRFALEVPAGSVPSFKSAHNKIIWALKVSGDIARWPDVSEEFELEVLPGPPEPGGPRPRGRAERRARP